MERQKKTKYTRNKKKKKKVRGVGQKRWLRAASY